MNTITTQVNNQEYLTRISFIALFVLRESPVRDIKTSLSTNCKFYCKTDKNSAILNHLCSCTHCQNYDIVKSLKVLKRSQKSKNESLKQILIYLKRRNINTQLILNKMQNNLLISISLLKFFSLCSKIFCLLKSFFHTP